MSQKILLIEDNDFLMDVYRDTLSDGGYVVTTAKNGKQGYEKARKGGWDLILLDIILPDIDGLDLVKKLNQSPPKEKNKSIVFLTSLDNQEHIEEAKKLGDGYIMKSQITPGELSETVNKYLTATS